MSEFYAPLAPEVLKRERARARELRASQWWKRRIADGVCYYCRRQVGFRALSMDHLVPLGQETFAQVRAQEPRPAGDQCTHDNMPLAAAEPKPG